MKVAVEVTVLLSGGDAVGEQDIERLLRSPETLHTLGEHKPAETPPWGLGRLLKTARQVSVTQSGLLRLGPGV